ncbi:MAG: hypothetical protein EZS28_020247 [Streblomastix strix]|uniref:Uncharacterized protein n=1 Tax=Streblomastix strix TaxID=222440 RepID=A0A5J4VNN7_9EUKA|nr:MAG: hypothetical protein EZS28_020247 [Streblomastix strix]
MQQLLDVPKPKLQAVIRRLLQEEDAEIQGTVDASLAMGTNQSFGLLGTGQSRDMATMNTNNNNVSNKNLNTNTNTQRSAQILMDPAQQMQNNASQMSMQTFDDVQEIKEGDQGQSMAFIKPADQKQNSSTQQQQSSTAQPQIQQTLMNQPFPGPINLFSPQVPQFIQDSQFNLQSLQSIPDKINDKDNDQISNKRQQSKVSEKDQKSTPDTKQKQSDNKKSKSSKKDQFLNPDDYMKLGKSVTTGSSSSEESLFLRQNSSQSSQKGSKLSLHPSTSTTTAISQYSEKSTKKSQNEKSSTKVASKLSKWQKLDKGKDKKKGKSDKKGGKKKSKQKPDQIFQLDEKGNAVGINDQSKDISQDDSSSDDSDSEEDNQDNQQQAPAILDFSQLPALPALTDQSVLHGASNTNTSSNASEATNARSTALQTQYIPSISTPGQDGILTPQLNQLQVQSLLSMQNIAPLQGNLSNVDPNLMMMVQQQIQQLPPIQFDPQMLQNMNMNMNMMPLQLQVPNNSLPQFQLQALQTNNINTTQPVQLDLSNLPPLPDLSIKSLPPFQGEAHISDVKPPPIPQQTIQPSLPSAQLQIDDDIWEKKLEQQINELQADYNKIPSVVEKKDYIHMTIGIVIIFVVFMSQLILLVVFVENYSLAPSNILLSGMRPPTLSQIQFFLLRVIANYSCVKPIDHIIFPTTTNPIWQDDSHVTTDRKLLLQVANKASDYFNKLQMDTHFGTS